jgi:uncharacterized protein YdeI (BOF family)
MRRRICSLWSLVMLALIVGMTSVAAQLNAQQAPDQRDSAQQGQAQQQPAQPPDRSGQPAPDPQTQSQSETQTFSGTIVKSSDKYVLQDSDSGVTYDIDRQDLARQHEGRKVRIIGTLDPNGKLIHVK